MKHYADGKVRKNLESIKEIEKAYGIDELSPFGTNHQPIFEEKIKDMDLNALNALAGKVGCVQAADIAEQTRILKEAFHAYQVKNPPNYGLPKSKEVKMDMRTNEGKRVMKELDAARTKSVFEKEFPDATEQAFRKRLNTFTLSDLQNLAAKAGYNPTFNQQRLVETLVEAFKNDLKTRP